MACANDLTILPSGSRLPDEGQVRRPAGWQTWEAIANSVKYQHRPIVNPNTPAAVVTSHWPGMVQRFESAVRGALKIPVIHRRNHVCDGEPEFIRGRTLTAS